MLVWRTFRLTGTLAELAQKYHHDHRHLLEKRRKVLVEKFGTCDVLLHRAGNGTRIEAIRDIGQEVTGLRASHRWRGYLETNKRTKDGKRLERILRTLDDLGPVELFQRIQVVPVNHYEKGVLQIACPVLRHLNPDWIVRVPYHDTAGVAATKEMEAVCCCE